MSGPTPGPWHWDDMTFEGHKRMREKGRKKLPGVTFARELVAADKWVMGSGADFYDCGPFDLVIATEADADLIAAAPDFFAAVTGPEYPDIQSRLDWLSAYLHDTADAVCPAKTEDPDAWQTARDHCEALLRDLRAALSKAEGRTP